MSPFQFINLVDLKAKMSLKSEASKLYLSYLWWVLEPILWVLAFYVVFTFLLDFGRNLLFLMVGKVPFLWFSKAVTNGSGSIISARGLINQTNIPKAFFPYLTVQETLYKQWVVFLVLFGMVMLYGHEPTWHWLWIIPLIFVQYLLTLACTMIAALLVSYARDIKVLISMSMIFLMFASGIFWDLDRIEDPAKRELLVTWNPLAYLLDAYRDVMMRNEVYDLQHLAVLGLVCLGTILFMHLIYRWKDQAIASRVINS